MDIIVKMEGFQIIQNALNLKSTLAISKKNNLYSFHSAYFTIRDTTHVFRQIGSLQMETTT